MAERLTPDQRVHHEEKVADYYNRANIFYFLMWHGRTFGQHYGFWSTGVKNRHEAILVENADLARLAQIKKGDLVLDAGCGVGGSSAWLAKNIGAEVVGINLSDVQLGIAKRVFSDKKYDYEVSDKTGLAKADYHNLPFLNGTFDVVWSLESIEHALSVEEFIKESFRVLKPGGRLVIAATLKGQMQPTDEEINQLKVGVETSGVFKDNKTGREVKRVMENSGFESVQLMDYTVEVIPSAQEITRMCRAWYGRPAFIKFLSRLVPRYVPPVLAMNNEWGLYQQDLFESGVTEYDILVGTKSPKTEN